MTMARLHDFYRREQPWTPESWRSYFDASGGFRQYSNRLELDLVMELLDPRPGERVLDAGCGYGRVAEAIVSSGASTVGVDISERMVAACKAQFLEEPVAVSVSDVAHPPFAPASFDKIACIGVLVHVADPEEVIAELARLLRPGGALVIVNNNALLLYFTAYYTLYGLGARYVRRLRGEHRLAPITRYGTPFWYRQLMERHRLCVDRIEGDTFAGVIEFKGHRIFPPEGSLGVFKRIDRLARYAPFKYFSFASYLRGIRKG